MAKAPAATAWRRACVEFAAVAARVPELSGWAVAHDADATIFLVHPGEVIQSRSREPTVELQESDERLLVELEESTLGSEGVAAASVAAEEVEDWLVARPEVRWDATFGGPALFFTVERPDGACCGIDQVAALAPVGHPLASLLAQVPHPAQPWRTMFTFQACDALPLLEGLFGEAAAGLTARPILEWWSLVAPLLCWPHSPGAHRLALDLLDAQ
mmetsp:Transcript_3411/g.8435  ORF Transcript_3411/g.8435 Transcript_3411/m.8435 type:complete len:215 (+) Transcript_3411:2206-2850(+)